MAEPLQHGIAPEDIQINTKDRVFLNLGFGGTYVLHPGFSWFSSFSVLSVISANPAIKPLACGGLSCLRHFRHFRDFRRFREKHRIAKHRFGKT